LKVVRGVDRATGLVVAELEGGYVSVSAPAAVREELRLAGTRYLPSTVTEATETSLLRSAAGKASLVVSAVASLGTNLYEYGLGEHKDKGIGSQEFWVSTGVDFGLSISIGLFAAAFVVGVAAATGAVVAAPVLLVATPIVGVILGVGAEIAGVAPTMKDGLNEFIDVCESEAVRLGGPPNPPVGPKGPTGPPQ